MAKDPVQRSEWREALTLIGRLEMVSHGVTRNYDSDGRGGGDGGSPGPVTGHRRAPKSDDGVRVLGDGNPEYLVLRQRLDRAIRAGDGRGVRRVRDSARIELRLARRGPKRTGQLAPKGSTAWKREIAAKAQEALSDGSRRSLREVARLYGTSHESVRTFLREYGERAEAA